ncbi:SDR family oxidoreductase [Bacillaceae bacterium SIJ1]|uniref:SDR family oxidoreductase n=1 Tax=Litoribacterium kuwaitense TaxID=1398745 RepID=UPI0013EC85A8|nr:SDR family NAD(P)-dependent oxidoreductase [Litoribacterium kuwaitense]NGP46135.1 SDR family oxidoreductase [Litoribacterium kuwaitense]
MKRRVAIITGGASGIGKATSLKLSSEGYDLALFDADNERLTETLQELTHHHTQHIGCCIDVSSDVEVQRAVNEVAEHFGHIDAVFANAGVNGTFAPIENLTAADWNHTMQTNHKSAFLITKYTIPYLKKTQGAIVYTSSVNGTRNFNNVGASIYSSSKAAQVAFMKMAALELGSYGIRVNAVCPGAIQTNIHERTDHKSEQLKKVTAPVEFPNGPHVLTNGAAPAEKVADVVSFLFSEQSAHISGTDIYVDGADSLLY